MWYYADFVWIGIWALLSAGTLYLGRGLFKRYFDGFGQHRR